MTDAMAALAALAELRLRRAPAGARRVLRAWQNEPLVVDKWLPCRRCRACPDTLARVKRADAHPAFDIKPNKVYALIGGFAANHVRFHAADGSGYAFLADQVIALDALNPQVAARMARAFDRWKKFDENRKAYAQGRARAHPRHRASKDVAEIVTKALA